MVLPIELEVNIAVIPKYACTAPDARRGKPRDDATQAGGHSLMRSVVLIVATLGLMPVMSRAQESGDAVACAVAMALRGVVGGC